jgi:hypothetical protein
LRCGKWWAYTLRAHVTNKLTPTLGLNERKKMKKKMVFVSLLLIVTSCTHIITREGYEINKTKINEKCEIQIVKEMVLDTAKGKIIGKVKDGDSGFSFACGEDDAIEIFKKEACNIGANIIDITEEKRADWLSSCYRATALLIKSNNVIEESKIEKMDSLSIKERVKTDQNRNTGIIIGTISACVALAIVSVIMSPHK